MLIASMKSNQRVQLLGTFSHHCLFKHTTIHIYSLPLLFLKIWVKDTHCMKCNVTPRANFKQDNLDLVTMSITIKSVQYCPKIRNLFVNCSL